MLGFIHSKGWAYAFKHHAIRYEHKICLDNCVKYVWIVLSKIKFSFKLYRLNINSLAHASKSYVYVLCNSSIILLIKTNLSVCFECKNNGNDLI